MVEQEKVYNLFCKMLSGRFELEAGFCCANKFQSAAISMVAISPEWTVGQKSGG